MRELIFYAKGHDSTIQLLAEAIGSKVGELPKDDLQTRLQTVSLGLEAAMGRGMVYTDAELTFDFWSHVVSVNGRCVYLVPQEYELLATLVTEPGVVISDEYLARAIWGDAVVVDGLTSSKRAQIVTLIRILRGKIEKDPPNPQLIITYRSIGYKYQPPVADSRR